MDRQIKTKLGVALLVVILAGGLIFGARWVKVYQAVSERRALEAMAREKAEAERLRAELAKAQAEAELARLKLDQEKSAIAAAKAAADAKAEAAAREQNELA